MVQHKQAPAPAEAFGGEAATALKGPPGFRALRRGAPSASAFPSYRELSLDLIQLAINKNQRKRYRKKESLWNWSAN